MFFTNPNQDVGTKLQNWWKEVPLFTRLILYISVLLCGIDLVSPLLASWLLIIPAYFLENFYLWQVLTFPYQLLGLLQLLFTMLVYMPTACRTERRLGTVRYISFFVLTNIILAVLYVALTRAASETGGSLFVTIYTSVPFSGLWPLIMVEIVIRCNKDPDVLVNFMCFPVQIKHKNYPWVFFFIFLLISPWAVGSLLVGIIVGYLRKI